MTTAEEAPLGLPLALAGGTRLYAIVGDPIDQAGSPGLFNQAFRRLGAQAVLVPMHVAPRDLGTLVSAFRVTQNWDGLVVTVPHKVAVIELLDDIGPSAQRTGAVNAIRKEDGRLIGENFDGIGFVEGLRAQGHEVRGRSVLLVGAGGAGRAVAHALADASAGRIDIFDIDRTRAATLAASVASSGGVPVAAASSREADGHDLVVNCAPTSAALEIDLSRALPDTLVVDIVLKPVITPLLADARMRGLKTHAGIHMLSGQVDAVLRFFSVADSTSWSQR